MTTPPTQPPPAETLDQLAFRIKTELSAMHRSLKDAVVRAMNIGDALIQAKKQLEHGKWLPYLKEKCDIPERTAQRCMEVANKRSEIEKWLKDKSATMADLTLAQALRLGDEDEDTQGEENKEEEGKDNDNDNDNNEDEDSAVNLSDKFDKLSKRLMDTVAEMDADTATAAIDDLIKELQKAARLLQQGKKKAA